jgi:hypothetical protein
MNIDFLATGYALMIQSSEYIETRNQLEEVSRNRNEKLK